MKKTIAILIITLFPLLVTGQKKTSITIDGDDIKGSLKQIANDISKIGNNSPRALKPFVVSLGLELDLDQENGNIITTLGYFFTPQIEGEMSLGSNFSDRIYLASGARVHFISKRSASWVTPFTGLLIGTDYETAFAQIPVGVNMAAKFGLNISLSLNAHMYFDSYNFYSADLRIGWRF